MPEIRDNKKYGYDQIESNFLQDLLARYLPYWPLFVIVLTLSITATWLYLRYAIPVYQANATMIIKDESKGLDDSKTLDALGIFGPKKIVENEIQIIQSRTLAKEVVKDLSLYAPVKSEGKFNDKSAYDFSPVTIDASVPDSLTEVKKVYFTYKNNQVKIGNASYPVNEWVNTPFGILRFRTNNHGEYISKRPLFFSLINVKKVAASLLGQLKVASGKQSTVLNLTYNDEVPRRAENILNALIKVYNQAAVNDKNALAANTLHFIEDRLRFVVGELDSVEGALQQYRTQNKIVDISAQGQLYLQTVGVNDQKMSDMGMQMAVLDEVENYVLGKSKKGGIVPSTLGITDPVLDQLLQKLYETELQVESLKKTTAVNNPLLVSLTDQIEKMKPSILENIRNVRISIRAGRQDLNNTNSKYSSMLKAIPQKERELLEISRQQSIKNNIYTFLLQKREETALNYASTVADSRLVDNAQAGFVPISPNKPLVYTIAVLFSLTIVIGFISLMGIINRSIMHRSEIEKYTSMSILGELIYDRSKNPIVISEGKRTFVAEQFRQLRTSLGYLGINSKKKRILVTSTITGEGKSFIAANLGMSLALMSKKVVLIELDLRKPKLSKIFNVKQTVGITDYFIDNKEAEEIIKPTEANANLFIISSGPIPPNPSELILNGKLQILLTYLETIFDYIIIDTSPVNPVTDAYIISPLCDATLYVVRYGLTPRAFIQKLDEQNSVKNLKNTAIIFNGIRQRGFAAYGYGSYGYGYGYVDKSESKKSRKEKEKEKKSSPAEKE
ncbi:MAG: GumC family protein [Flavisolibacter sp.]